MSGSELVEAVDAGDEPDAEAPTYVDRIGRVRRVPGNAVRLIEVMFDEGCSIHEASRLTGLSASNYANQPWFVDYVRDRMSPVLVKATARALSVMIGLLDHSDPQIRRQAAKDILDRGLGTVTRHQVSGSVSINVDLGT
jgi:hypothetical protein